MPSWGARQSPSERHGKHGPDRDQGQAVGEEGAGHVEPSAHQREREDQAPGGLGHEADGDDAVAAEALERPTLHAEHRPQHPGHGHGGGRPGLVDADDARDDLAQRDRDHGDHDHGHGEPLQPRPDARPRVRILARKRARQLAGDGDL